MDAQARIGTDGGTSESETGDAVLDALPPEKLLETTT